MIIYNYREGIIPRGDADHKLTVVATGGCFDLIHVGHIKMLEACKRLGNILVVCLNDDRSFQLNKHRMPYNFRRDMIVDSIKYVDYVVEFSEETPCEIIRKVKPDIWVKGIDWLNKTMEEKVALNEYSGQLVFIEHEYKTSTSEIIRKIKEV